MMTRHAFAAGLMALAAHLPLNAMAAEYSADTLRAAPGMPPQSGKIFVGKDSMRTESQMRGGTVVEIVSRADGTVRTIMPDEGVYMEIKVEPSLLPAMGPPEAPCIPAPQLACAKVGDAEINGMKAERWDITPAGAPAPVHVWWDSTRKFPLRQELPDGRVMQSTLRSMETYEGAPVESWEFVFLAPDGSFVRTLSLYSATLGMPVLTQQPNGMVLQLSNIKATAPDEALFKLPEGLRRIEPGAGPMPPIGIPPAPAGQPQAANTAQPPTQPAAPASAAPKTAAPQAAAKVPDHSATQEDATKKREPGKP